MNKIIKNPYFRENEKNLKSNQKRTKKVLKNLEDKIEAPKEEAINE